MQSHLDVEARLFVLEQRLESQSRDIDNLKHDDRSWAESEKLVMGKLSDLTASNAAVAAQIAEINRTLTGMMADYAREISEVKTSLRTWVTFGLMAGAIIGGIVPAILEILIK